jgi:hypothetical protein
MEIITEEKEFVQAKCECGNEIMELDYWKAEKMFCFAQFHYAPIRYSFKERIRFLFTGNIEYNVIIFTEENAKPIADYINKHLSK